MGDSFSYSPAHFVHRTGPELIKLFSCSTQLSMKFVLLINIKLLTIANSFLRNIAEHENFSANEYENANTIVGIFIFISREIFMLSWVKHEKRFITSGPGFRTHLMNLFFRCWSEARNYSYQFFLSYQGDLTGLCLFRYAMLLGEFLSVSSAIKYNWIATSKQVPSGMWAQWRFILAVCLESSLDAFWIAKDAKFLHAPNEDSDQTARMGMLIWVFVGRTSYKVTFLKHTCCGG